MIKKNYFDKNLFLIFGLIFLSVNFSVFAQTNIDSMAGRFQQLSKQVAELEKYVFNNEGELTKVISSGQQKRIDALENAVKELRGIVEVDLSLLKQEVDKINSIIKNQSLNSDQNISSTSKVTNNNLLEQEILALNDKIRLIDSRFNMTLDLIGKSEIRIMRMESLMNSENFSANKSMESIMSNNELSSTSQDLSNIQNTPTTNASQNVGQVDVSQSEDGTLGVLSVNNDEIEKPISTILPDLSPEEQYKFSFELALKRKYDEAELALKEFMDLHPNHEKTVDAHYWYGGVLYRQKKYEDASFSDIAFNENYPDDPRIIETTLRIAKSMNNFAEPEQACLIFENSLKFINDPPENFVRKINELKADKACD